MSDIKELKDEELVKVTGGGYHGEFDAYDPPKRYVYTVEQRAIVPGLLVRRVVDRKEFRCVGYENNNDNTTLWVFHSESGATENIIYRACSYDEVISDFCLT